MANAESKVIDITNTVESMRQTFVSWASSACYMAIVSNSDFAWLNLPVLSSITKFLIRLVLNTLSEEAVMQAFFLNTAIRKDSQAADYVNAVNAKNALSTNASEADYANAEANEIAAFNSFVTLGD